MLPVKSQTKILVVAGALALLLILAPMNSSAAEDLIKEFEGLRLTAYPDVNGYAIGYGSHYNYDAGRNVVSTDIITQQTADKWLQMRNAENKQVLDSAVQVPITRNQEAALLSLMYNEGSSAIANSTLVSMLNAGEPIEDVADQFDRWVLSGGVTNPDLVARRAKEKALFLS